MRVWPMLSTNRCVSSLVTSWPIASAPPTISPTARLLGMYSLNWMHRQSINSWANSGVSVPRRMSRRYNSIR